MKTAKKFVKRHFWGRFILEIVRDTCIGNMSTYMHY